MGRKFCHSTKCLILFHFVLCTWCCFTNHFRRLYIYIWIRFVCLNNNPVLSAFMSDHVTRVTRRMSLVKQELFILLFHLPVFLGYYHAIFNFLCCVLQIIVCHLSFFFWPLHLLSSCTHFNTLGINH